MDNTKLFHTNAQCRDYAAAQVLLMLSYAPDADGAAWAAKQAARFARDIESNGVRVLSESQRYNITYNL